MNMSVTLTLTLGVFYLFHLIATTRAGGEGPFAPAHGHGEMLSFKTIGGTK